ncbi:female sterile (1) Nasrat [Musca autumnalis]|uniref:female sterile (1) Nasrat n=1 Tax=Musca autumnalis TaxID=221902 RepID=UPI003CEB965E
MSWSVWKNFVLFVILLSNFVIIQYLFLVTPVDALVAIPATQNVKSEQKHVEDNVKNEEELKVSRPNIAVEPEIRKKDEETSKEDILKPSLPILSSSGILKDFNETDLRDFQNSIPRSQDLLFVKSMEQDLSFNWPAENVSEWLHLSYGGHSYYIGRRSKDLVVVRADKNLNQTSFATVNVQHPITSIEAYSYWNFEQQRPEGLLLIAAGRHILWYRNYPELANEFEFFGNWTLDNEIKQMQYFSYKTRDYLLVSFDRATLDIYYFKMKSKKVKVIQTLQLDDPISEMELLPTGEELLLILTQTNKVLIYGHNPNDNSKPGLRFQAKQIIETPQLHTLKGFKIMGKTYLATAGNASQILSYQAGHFKPMAILDSSFGQVDSFMPIPVKTHRDHFILLTQHHSLNESSSLDVLTWNGNNFQNNLPLGCYKGSQKHPAGLCYKELNLKAAILHSQNDEQISLLSPTPNGNSQLFHLHFETLEENLEYLLLKESFELLKGLAKERDQLISEAHKFLLTPEEILLQQMINEISHLETPEFHFDGEAEEIYLNDHKWSPEDDAIELDFLIETLNELEAALSSARPTRELEAAFIDQLNLDTLLADELEIANLNGEKFFIENGVLKFPGEIEINHLEVADAVWSKHKRQLEEDLDLEGDLEFDFINGLKWEEFIKNVVMKNQEQELEMLKVEGEVIVENVLQINTLNSLAFPDDYLVAQGPRSSIVRAEKYFNKTLSANSVDTDGYINGQNPVDAITLMHGQEWLGSPVFNQLEVSEVLELNGTAHGRNVANFPANPTLEESNIIEAACVFNDLQVNGPIVIKGDLDEKPLGQLLSDILQRSEDPNEDILVNSPKSFALLRMPIDFELETNEINGIKTEQFVTVHTPQVLELSILEGYVYFYNLTVKGLYDGFRIEDVARNVISLDKPLDLSTTHLMFEDQTLQAESLIILDKINGINIKDSLQSLQEDLIVETAEFEDLQATTAEFSNDIVGPGKLNNIELHDFVKDRAWHEPAVQGNLFLNELQAHQGLQADELHGINAEYLLDFLQRIEELPEMVLNGQIQVDHITVTGDVQLHKLNGQQFDEDIQMSAIWLNRPNHLNTKLSFKSPLDVQGNLVVKGKYQGMPLSEFLEDMVIRDSNSSSSTISAPKSFIKPVYVLENTQVVALNGVPFNSIALKTRQNIFPGSLKIKGKLITPHLEVQGRVNDVDLQDLQDILYYDSKQENFVFKGLIEFEQPVVVEDLTVLGDFMELDNLSDFFENVIYKSHSCHLGGNNNFTGRVSIVQGAYIEHLNNLNLQSLFQKLAFIQGLEPLVITSPLVFEAPIKAQQISIHKSLKTEKINNCSLSEWLNDTLRLDQNQYVPHYLHFAPVALDGNSLNVAYINHLDLSRIITLNTPQIFNESLQFSEVYLQDGFIEVNGSVNGIDLEEEYNNTLMVYGGQHITTPLTIQSIKVLKDLQILGIVNGNKNLSDVATLEENLELQSPVYFHSLYSPQVITQDLVTGIDLDKWFRSTLKASSLEKQYIMGNWSARSLTVRRDNNEYQYPVFQEYDPWTYDQFMRYRRGLSKGEDDKELCQMLKKIWLKIELKSLVVKYVEESFFMEVDSLRILENVIGKRRKFFFMPNSGQHYLLLNEECTSRIYLWMPQERRFKYLHYYDSGPIAEVMVLPNPNSTELQFITNYESTEHLNCSLGKGVTVWNLRDNETSPERFYFEDVWDMQRSNNSGISILVLNRDVVRELDLATFETLRKWKIQFKERLPNKNYRFVKLSNSCPCLLVTNGVEIVPLTEIKRKSKIKKNVGSDDADDKEDDDAPSYVQLPSTLELFEYESISVLRPNESVTNILRFSDFPWILERMLMDLSSKLNQQINITQLSIPESDLFDEYLIPDFVGIMEELEHQTIYEKDLLNISSANVSLPETPGQVLTAHVVQIVWPFAEELQEMQLHINETLNSTLYGEIKNSLASFIASVLKEANGNKSQDHSEDLFRVIETIRQFDKVLHGFLKDLKNTTWDHGPEDTDKMLYSSSNLKERIFTKIPLSHNNKALRTPELISLQVGSINNSRPLLALTKISFPTLIPGQDSAIYLYEQDFQDNPLQIINAQDPHSLIEFRLKQETLLMFIDNCCEVQIWRYRGTQGFVLFAKLSEDKEIQQIEAMSLPNAEGVMKHYLVMLTGNKLKFNEIVVQGITQAPPPLPCP